MNRRNRVVLTAALPVLAAALLAIPAANSFAAGPAPASTVQTDTPRAHASHIVGNRRIDNATGVVRAWYHLDEPAASPVPEQAARDFFKTHAASFGGANVVDGLEILAVKHSRAGRHVHLRQTWNGLSLYQARFNLSLNLAGAVTFVTANPLPGFSLPSTRPSYGESEAVAKTRALLKGAECRLDPPDVRLMGFRDEKDVDHLAYVVDYPSEHPLGDWEVIWDAADGSHLATYDLLMYEDGTGMAFDPDPLSTARENYGAAGFTDNNDADTPQLNGERVEVTLHDLTQSGGSWHLQGPYVTLNDFDSPTAAPVTADSLTGFSFTRSQSGFEDVMVYYHIDAKQRKIQSLGFDDLQNGSIVADPHGVDGQDNSYYSPVQNRLSFGEGGVDDAEDSDVILHEYGHAMHHDAVGSFSSFDIQCISEGFGDYMAATYSARLSDYHDTWVYNWDGHNTFWGGRTMTSTGIYPGDWGTSDWDLYTNGSIWANTLWRIRAEMEPDTADALILQGLYYQGSNSNVVDAAEGLLQAEQDLYDGRYHQAVYSVLATKGFVEPAGTVEGTVADGQTSSLLEGARVVIATDPADTTTSDAEGAFVFSTVTAGTYTVTVSMDGYASYSENVTVQADQTVTVQAVLQPVSVSLDPDSLSLALYADTTLDTVLQLQNQGGDLDWAAHFAERGAEPVEPFDPLVQFNVEDVTGDTRMSGVTVFNGLFVVTGSNTFSNPNRLYMFNVNGELVRTVLQESVTNNGYLDLTTDGTLIYGSEDHWIVGFDEDGTVLDSIEGPANPNRAIAYDPDRDWFWCADNMSDIMAVDRDGNLQATFNNTLSVKGLGYYPYAPDGMNLYITSQEGGAYTRVTRMNPDTGELSEPYDLPSGASGGHVLGADVVCGVEGAADFWVCAAVVDFQATGHELEVYKVARAVPYLDVSPRRGTIGGGETLPLTLHVDATGLPAGVLEAEMHVSVPSANTTIVVPVRLAISAVSAPETTQPLTFKLDPAYPNPFNPSTVVGIRLPERGDVTLAVYDITGRRVDRRIYRGLSAGEHRMEWRAPAGMASGVYFIRVDAGAGRMGVQKVVLLK